MSSVCVAMSHVSVTISRCRLSLLLFVCVCVYTFVPVDTYERYTCGNEWYVSDHIDIYIKTFVHA